MSASLYATNRSPPLSSTIGGHVTGSTSATTASAAAVTAAGASSTIHSNLSVKYEVNASALSVDATGSFGVLAGRRGLHIVDLEALYLPAATLHHQTKWDVAVVQCNPHVQFRSHVASTSNHNALIWDVASAQSSTSSISSASRSSKSTSSNAQPLLATLRAHTRPVSDVAWSPTEPWVLATCSADTKTHLWDMRTPHKPVLTLHAFTTSANCVAWNHVDQTSLATAHDGDVRIWDTRAADRTAAIAITAHMQKIYGIDWHPLRPMELVTCSEDKSVKIWNVATPRVCQAMLQTGAPVWRARYAPFGDALVTIAHRVDPTVRLWAVSHPAATDSSSGSIAIEPVHAFSGHSDLVKSVVWRHEASTNAFQLVSWAKNQELRLWRIDSVQLEACGVDVAAADALHTAPAALRLRAAAADSARLQHARTSKYDIATLRNDFVPLVVPPTAVPLGALEYCVDGHADSISALLILDEDLAKIGERDAWSDEEEDVTIRNGKRSAAMATAVDTKSDTMKPPTDADVSSAVGRARALPCPRVFGASFSGPNRLVVFDARAAIGIVPHTTTTLDKSGKMSSSTETTIKKKRVAPRTYDELLELRDVRFATMKKLKKPGAKLVATTANGLMGIGGIGGMGLGVGGGGSGNPNSASRMDLQSDWNHHHDVFMDLAATNNGLGLFGAGDIDDNVTSHTIGATSSSLYFGNANAPTTASASAALLDPSTALLLDQQQQQQQQLYPYEKSIHGGSEYLQTYFATNEFHLPINHPDHRISLPPPAAAANGLSPRSSAGLGLLQSTTGNSSDRTKRLENATSNVALHAFDGSLSVTIFDLSTLCGVSPILTFATALTPQFVTASQTDKRPLESGSRSLLTWMLQAAERTARVYPVGQAAAAPQKTPHHLSNVLQTLLQPPSNDSTVTAAATNDAALFQLLPPPPSEPTHSVSNTCAHNARVATLAGRRDLHQVWSLLEAATAPVVQLPFGTVQRPSTGIELASTHPWSAHPFGKRLVDKVLRVYEQAGDLPTVASIVCALAPVETSVRSNDSSNSNDDDSDELQYLIANAPVSGSMLPTTTTTTTMRRKLTGGGTGSFGDSSGPFTIGSSADDEFYVVSGDVSGMRSRRSSNTLSLLAEDAMSSDIPPAMKHARRSMSHTDAATRSSFGGSDLEFAMAAAAGGMTGMSATASALRAAKEPPMGSASSSNASRLLSPVRTPRGRSTAPGTPLLRGASGAPPPSLSTGWRMDFESPFKTWSGASVSKGASPKRLLTSETFQSPVPSMPEHGALFDGIGGSGSVRYSTRYDVNGGLSLDGMDDDGDRGSNASIDSDDDVASDHIALQLSYCVQSDAATLLSSDAVDIARYDAYKTAYADLLYRYGATDRRADVLQTVAIEDPVHEGVAFVLLCHRCQTETDGPVCPTCHDFSIKCSVCQLVVRGQSMFCLTCGHGGHAEHLRSWFEVESSCPTGCGCWCKAATSTSAFAPTFALSDVPQEHVPSRSYSF